MKDVLQKHVDYYKELINEKKRKEQALLTLRNYLDNIDSALVQSDEQMEHLHFEKRQTIEKLDLLREEMKKLMDKTRNIY